MARTISRRQREASNRVHVGRLFVAGVVLLTLFPGAVAYEEVQTDQYYASAGVNALGYGAASNLGPLGPGRYWAAQSVTHVRVTVDDGTGFKPWVTVCVDQNNNNVCATSDGDLQASGAGTVTLATTGSNTFRQVQVYAYAANVPASGAPNVATSGVVTLHFWT